MTLSLPSLSSQVRSTDLSFLHPFTPATPALGQTRVVCINGSPALSSLSVTWNCSRRWVSGERSRTRHVGRASSSLRPSSTYQSAPCICATLMPFLRAVLRLVLLKITKRPLISPLIPEREFDPAALPELSDSPSPTLAPSSPPSSMPSTPEHFKNNHAPLPPHPFLAPPPPHQSPQPIEDFLLPKALTTASVKAPTSLIRAMGCPRDWVAEIIYTLRPLIYGKLLECSDRVAELTSPLSGDAVVRSQVEPSPVDGLGFGIPL